MRNERIRTYNFPQGSVTDHRIGLTLYKIDAIMDGTLDELIDALVTADQAKKLQSNAAGILNTKGSILVNTILFTENTKGKYRKGGGDHPRGGLLGIPTETVYGLGANALNADACRRIYEAKGRPQDNPLIIHVPDASWLARYCEKVPESAVPAGRARSGRDL